MLLQLRSVLEELHSLPDAFSEALKRLWLLSPFTRMSLHEETQICVLLENGLCLLKPGRVLGTWNKAEMPAETLKLTPSGISFIFPRDRIHERKMAERKRKQEQDSEVQWLDTLPNRRICPPINFD